MACSDYIGVSLWSIKTMTSAYLHVKVQGHTEMYGECIDRYVKMYCSKAYECDFLWPLTLYVCKIEYKLEHKSNCKVWTYNKSCVLIFIWAVICPKWAGDKKFVCQCLIIPRCFRGIKPLIFNHNDRRLLVIHGFFSLHHQQLPWTHTAARRRRDPVTMTITSILVSGN